MRERERERGCGGIKSPKRQDAAKIKKKIKNYGVCG